jgi:hypothetical protein
VLKTAVENITEWAIVDFRQVFEFNLVTQLNESSCALSRDGGINLFSLFGELVKFLF